MRISAPTGMLCINDLYVCLWRADVADEQCMACDRW